MRSFVGSVLESDGNYIVDEVKDGFDALRLLPRNDYALVITDINMPDINGLELVRFIRDNPQQRDTPLIIISTDGRDRDRERGMKLGANAYLVKPFQPDELLAAAQRCLAARGQGGATG